MPDSVVSTNRFGEPKFSVIPFSIIVFHQCLSIRYGDDE